MRIGDLFNTSNLPKNVIRKCAFANPNESKIKSPIEMTLTRGNSITLAPMIQLPKIHLRAEISK